MGYECTNILRRLRRSAKGPGKAMLRVPEIMPFQVASVTSIVLAESLYGNSQKKNS